jgi:hypothetical protein
MRPLHLYAGEFRNVEVFANLRIARGPAEKESMDVLRLDNQEEAA